MLRYGGLYGPGATDDQVELVRKRQFPLVGSGSGYCSWVHVDDAASATLLAVEQKATGVFNIVDDEPAPAGEWLPYLAECVGANQRSMCLKSGLPACPGLIAVITWTTVSGWAPVTALRTDSASSPSITTPFAPSSASRPSFPALVVVAVTS